MKEKERLRLERAVRDEGGLEGGENDQVGARRSEEYDEDRGPEKEIRAFVLRKWRVEEGWETAWCVAHVAPSSVPAALESKQQTDSSPQTHRFANPPGLQSVPGLAHFHVLARRHPVETDTSQ